MMLQAPPGRPLDEADDLTVHVAGAELNACAAVVACGGRTAFGHEAVFSIGQESMKF